MVGEVGPDVGGRLLVPVGQEVVEAVVAQGLHGRGHAVAGQAQGLGGAWKLK